MSSLVQVIGLMPSETDMRGFLQKAERFELATQLLGRLEMDAMDAERSRGPGVGGIVVDEHGRLRIDRIAVEQDAEDPHVGLDDAFLARHDDAVELRQEVEARP